MVEHYQTRHDDVGYEKNGSAYILGYFDHPPSWSCVCGIFMVNIITSFLGGFLFRWSFYIITDIMNTPHALKFKQLVEWNDRLEYRNPLHWNLITWQFPSNTFVTVGAILNIGNSDKLILFTIQRTVALMLVLKSNYEKGEKLNVISLI